MTAVMFTNARIFDGTIGDEIAVGQLLVRDGVIADVAPDIPMPDEDVEVIDLDGALLVPGYIDIHCHGAVNLAYDDGVSGIDEILRAHHRHGTTRAVMSLVTGSISDMAELISEAAVVVNANERLIGIHPEGPFLHPNHKGAHEESLLTDPSRSDVQALIDAADGTLSQITLAPEREGGIDAIRMLVDAGVAVAVGHTSSTYEQAREAFDAGATILTHAFNAMKGIHHRAPGPVIAALRDERVWIEVINDGVHVHPMVIKSLFAEAPERMVLITDAMSATCASDGRYLLGKLDVEVQDGIARLVDSGNLAGSTLTMDKAVANAITSVGVDIDVAVAAATSHPAQAVGIDDKAGYLRPGYDADFLVLDPDTYLPRDVYLGGVKFED